VREVLLIFPAATQPQSQPRPGILIVTLHEGVGFSLPDQYKQVFSGHQPNSLLQGNEFGVAGPLRPGSSQHTGSISSSYASSTRPQTSGGGFNAIPTNHGRFSSKYLPYAVLDFDKSQVFVNSVSGTPENPLWAGDNTSYKFDVSQVTELAVHLYLRNPNATPGSGRSQDIFLGVARINPRFEESHKYVEDPKLSKKDEGKAAAEFNQKEKTRGQSSAEWLDVQYGTGKIRIGVEYVENRTWSLSIEDFDLLENVREGSSGTVLQVMKKDTQRIYAFKTIRNAHIISRSEVAHTLAERSVLAQINNPFIVPLKFTFQSPEKLYFVSPFVHGGELFYHLQKEQRFDVNRSRFYTAQLLCALECLHGFNVIYRDLKPENILLDYSGYIALCDFGLYKLDMKDEDRTNTICGTPEYLAPELLLRQGYTKTVDWWTLGVLLYEMLTGLPPFYDENTNEMYRKILSEPLYFPGPDIVPPTAKDILTKLLNRKPQQRLGANGASEIKAHPFFHSIDWRKLLQRKYEPTFKPNDAPMLSQTIEQQFHGWSYNRPVPELADGGGSLKDPSFVSVQDNVSTHSNTSLIVKHDGTVATDIVASVTDEETMGNNIERKIETNTSEKDSTLAEDHNGSSPLPGKDATAEGPLLTDEADPLLPSEAPPAAVEEDGGWAPIWEEAAQAFYFYNRFTGATQSTNPRVPHPVAPGVEAPAAQKPPATRPAGGYDPATHGDYDPTAWYAQAFEPEVAEHTQPQEPAAAFHGDEKIVKLLLSERPSGLHNLASERQMQGALEAALKAGHKHVVLQLLDHGMDLNIQIFDRSGQTPLEWATEHENLDLVKLFLDKGANANFTIGRSRPALLKAVEKGNPGLVKVLVHKTDRVTSTRALSLAVNQQDSTIVNILLENSVSCDFEESDRPRPDLPDSGCTFNDSSEPEESIPPLVRAVNLGNMNLVRLLLANGADVNVGYHDLACQQYPQPTQISISCGRVVQLAMDLGHQDIVHLLLDSGADINLKQPVRRFHECWPVQRAVYLKVTAGLRAAAAARK
jgi:serum/glucocorticoid-regulated kinase 2